MHRSHSPFLLLLALIPAWQACAQPPAGYYDAAQGLNGPALRSALHGIIDGHTPLSYDELWNAFPSTDATAGGIVWDIYSDVPGGTPPYTYAFGQDQCGNYDEEGDCYNREHSFPKSWFNDAQPMYTDLFHIYPTDGWVNNKRGNLPYGDVGSPDWTSLNGSKTGLCTDPGYNGTVFEPIDAYKGDLARTYFYMMTRYQGEMAGWSSPMLASGDLAPWAREVLLAWNQQDPVSPKETERNNAIFNLQHNRNPFIDHPEWAAAIWDPESAVQELPRQAASLRSMDGFLQLDGLGEGSHLLRITDGEGRTAWQGRINGPEATVALKAAHGLYIATVQLRQGPWSASFSW
jgi:endonuclease I